MRDITEPNAPHLEYLVRASDIILLYAAGYLSALAAHPSTDDALSAEQSAVLYFCIALAPWIFSVFGLYSSWRGRSQWSLCRNAALALLTVLTSGIVFGFLIRQPDELPRAWIVAWYLASLTGMTLSRTLLYAVLARLRERGFNEKRVIIVGYGLTGRELHRRAIDQRWTGYRVVASCDTEGGSPLDSRIKTLFRYEDVAAEVERQRAHEVWITLPLHQCGELQSLQQQLGNTLVDIRWIPDVAALQMLSHKVVEVMGMPVIEINRPALHGFASVAKDVFDRVFAASVIIGLSPLLLAIAVAIKCTSAGPVLFRQPRLGLNGRRFYVLKFRSMRIHDESGDRVTQATRNDPRITTVGHFLRKTSLDELPQFFNVLTGDMSVVGPRPHALAHNDLYKDKLAMYMQRHRVKPGITGWAQINGYRGETDTVKKMERRVEFDLYYIRHWSFWMDMKIVIWTAFRGWTGKNAY